MQPKRSEDFGFEKLISQIKDARPTVIIVGYGANAAYSDQQTNRFAGDLNRLLDELDQMKARIVLFSPIRQEAIGQSSPDPKPRNARLQLITKVLRQTAKKRGYGFVDLYSGLCLDCGAADSAPLTENGIHLSQQGYQAVARVLLEQLSLPSSEWTVHLQADASVVAARGTHCSNMASTKYGFALDVQDALLPTKGVNGPRILKITGLKPGRYSLTVDGQRTLTDSAQRWAQGVEIGRGPFQIQDVASSKSESPTANNIPYAVLFSGPGCARHLAACRGVILRVESAACAS